jgi:trk system potassium uptake protein TrkH
VAIVTTTGFGTADYELWAPVATGILFLLFFCGGMAGSTGGGVKVVRHVLLGKSVYKELRQLVHPQAILPIRLNDEVVSRDVINNILAFIVLYLGLLFGGTIVVSALGLDLWSAFTAALSCVGNIGPAFGSVGPTDNYAHIPALGKWVLTFLMVAGRLEIYTVLILLTPAFWRR